MGGHIGARATRFPDADRRIRVLYAARRLCPSKSAQPQTGVGAERWS
ncbi:hypothetical protein I552_9780 [Mycobacterium xenopi 3993]|nr:hypothetical protein I552_9780 [Mycobacterium xenopi 3993]